MNVSAFASFGRNGKPLYVSGHGLGGSRPSSSPVNTGTNGRCVVRRLTSKRPIQIMGIYGMTIGGL